MALVKCPACGNSVSENANACPVCGEPIAAKISSQIESGTEIFTIQAGNRIELTAKTQVEINTRTARLNSEGKTVVNVNTSVPQPFTLGVTVWKNDVTIIWNASLGTEKYKAFLYSQGKQYYQTGQYNKAYELFNKLNGYSDSRTLASHCSKVLSEQNAARLRASQATAQLRKAVGTDPSDTTAGLVRYIVGGVLLLFGVFMLITAALNLDTHPNDHFYINQFIWSLVITGIGAICIIWNRIQHNRYEKKVSKFKWSSHSTPPTRAIAYEPRAKQRTTERA